MQRQSISSPESPQVTFGRFSLFCDCLLSWKNLVAAKLKVMLVVMILKTHLFLSVSKDCI
jgi:hypothetical protein